MNHAQARTALSSAAEAAVVVLAASGDDQAFAELVRRRQSWLRSLLRRLSRDAALADDLAQQAFITMWRKLPFDERTAEDLIAQSAAGTDPSAALDLDRLLAMLKPAERLCVVLCHAEGMSHAEIVAITGWPLGTVKSHVARGAARLRELLGEESG